MTAYRKARRMAGARTRKALLGICTSLGLAATVAASDGRNPASLLLYPEFDNRTGVVTVLSITNVQTGEAAEDVDVELVYIGRFGPSGTDLNCGEFNATITLTPADTWTALTRFHNPEHQQGYVYAFAKDGNGNPLVHNWLTGNLLTVDGLEVFEYSVNPVAYIGIGNGTSTDLDGDGFLDMNGCEYSANPDKILIPRFLGQGGPYVSELILIGLSGGTAFDTTIDFLIFNDNEEIFSSEHTFRCWERVTLLDISNIFANNFLQNWTNDDPDELLGAPHIETGWIHIQGALANSSATTITNPSVYAVLVEHIGSRGASDLPFEDGERTNGELLPRSVTGDTTDVTCP
jgi:hypothetical protein